MRTLRMFGQALRGLARNRLRSFFMMIGVTVGITVLTVVLAAGMGARERIMERVRVFGLENLMVWAGGSIDRTRMGQVGGSASDVTATLKREDAVSIRSEIFGVRVAAPFARRGGGELQWRDRSFTAPVFGVTPEWLEVWDWHIERGAFITHMDDERMVRKAVLGPTVVAELFGDEDPMGQTLQVGGIPFEVTGTMREKGTSAGGGDMDNRVFVPLNTYLRRVANQDHLDGIRVGVGDVRMMEEVVQDISSLLRDRHRLSLGEPDDFRITTPTEITAMVEELQGTFNLFLVLVAAIALVVGGVVVANIMLLSVNERRREIGVRRAVGAKARDIRLQFLLEAAGVTLIGGIGGLLLGALVSAALASWSETPALLTWHVLAAGLLFSSVVGITAGLHPARKAADMTPVEALRS